MKNYQSSITRIATLAVCFFTIQTLNAQWPQWRGPMRDGSSVETNLLKTWPVDGPKLVWVSDTVGEGFSSATVQDKVIYTTGKRDSVEIMTALDLNGKIIWQKEFGKALKKDWPESRSTPTLYKNKLYALTAAGDMACLDSKTGSIVWAFSIYKKFDGVSTYNGFGESPLVVDDKVILSPCGKKTTLVALNSATGETIWSSESIADTNLYVSPVLVQNKDKKLIVTNVQNHVLAVDINSGKIVWKEKASLSMVPLPFGNQIYFSGTNGGKMLKISDDLSNLNFQWSDTIKTGNFGGTVRLGNRIYGVYDKGITGIFCLDWKSGKTLSFNKLIGPANLLAADGMIYSYEDRNGHVSLLKPTDNSIDMVSSFKVKLGKGPNIAHMVIADGILYIRHGKYLMAYDIKHL